MDKYPGAYSGVQCPKCPRKIGSLALYCPACGTKLLSAPHLENPTEFHERRNDNISGKLCGLTHHRLMAKHHLPINVQSEISPMVFCPDCGVNITDCHPDFQTP